MVILCGIVDLGEAKNRSKSRFGECRQDGFERLNFHSINTDNLKVNILLHADMIYNQADYYHYDPETGLVVVMAGNMYNNREVYENNAYGSSALSNPKLIFELYKEHGETFVHILNGDFAIVIYDPQSKLVLLYRDHLGIRPLAYSWTKDEFYFSTDILGLCSSVDDSIDESFLVQFLQDSSYIEYRALPTKKVNKLLPGHYLKANSKKCTQQQYWFPEKIRLDKNLSCEIVVEELSSLVRDAVKIRCDQSRKGASHLSGGLDSSLVSALTRMEYCEQDAFPGLSWSPGNEYNRTEYYDERSGILELSEEYRIEPVFCNLNVDEYWKDLSDWRYYSYMFYEHNLLKTCKRHGVKSLFSGWGGDEFLSINDRGLYYDLFFKMKWSLLLKKKPITRPKDLVNTMIYKVLLPALGIACFKKPNDKWSYIFFKAPHNKQPNRNTGIFKTNSRHSTHIRQLYNYHIPWRTEMEYILGCKYGVEYRYPLLDKRIIEYVLKIPSQIIAQFPYSRPLIREVSKDILPDSIRLHISKEDSVRLSYLEDHYKKTLPLFIEELDQFKRNPDLKFIDFANLGEAIYNYQQNTYRFDKIDFLVLLNNVKKMHEFTKGYREKADIYR